MASNRPMGIYKKPPVFVPAEHYAEVMSLSKAALADMCWDYAQQLAGAKPHGLRANPDDATIAQFRARRDIVLNYRK